MSIEQRSARFKP